MKVEAFYPEENSPGLVIAETGDFIFFIVDYESHANDAETDLKSTWLART